MAKITIEKLTYQAWRILEGGNIPDDSRFAYGEIRDHVRSALMWFLKGSLFESLNVDPDIKYGDTSLSFTKEYEIQKSTTEGAFIEIEGTQISSPIPGRLTQVYPENMFDVNAPLFIPVSREEVMLSKLQSANPPNTVLYVSDGNKIRLFGKPVQEGYKVLVSRQYTLPDSDTEELQVGEEHGFRVVTEVVRVLNGEVRPSDRENDGVPINN